MKKNIFPALNLRKWNNKQINKWNKNKWIIIMNTIHRGEIVLKNNSFILLKERSQVVQPSLIKFLQKKQDGNYTRMLQVILNKSCKQQSTKQKLYGHSPTISLATKERGVKYAGHNWRSKNELICSPMDSKTWICQC